MLESDGFSNGKQPITPKQPSDVDSVHEYDFKYSKRGICIVINNMQFDKETRQKTRFGSEKDRENIKETFTNLGFTVKAYDNCTSYEMYSKLTEESKANHSDEDCFVCVILSHGAQYNFTESNKEIQADVVYGKDSFILMKDLTDLFTDENCPTLIGKPKIFISQACRGTKLSEGVEFLESVNTDGDRQIAPKLPQGTLNQLPIQEEETLLRPDPIEVDFLLACSSPPGFFSFRSSKKGSFFIKAICDQLTALHNRKDLLSIFTRVNHQVAYEYESYAPSTPEINKRKQMPWIASKLTKDIFFRKKAQ